MWKSSLRPLTSRGSSGNGARFEDELTNVLDEFAQASSGWFSRTYADGREGLAEAYRGLVARRVDPSQLVIARPNG